MNRSVLGAAIGVIGLALLIVATWINVDVLCEAYGSGAPYFSQTTNMDKWTNPLPYLIPIDFIVLLVAFLAMRFSVKTIRPRHSRHGT